MATMYVLLLWLMAGLERVCSEETSGGGSMGHFMEYAIEMPATPRAKDAPAIGFMRFGDFERPEFPSGRSRPAYRTRGSDFALPSFPFTLPQQDVEPWPSRASQWRSWTPRAVSEHPWTSVPFQNPPYANAFDRNPKFYEETMPWPRPDNYYFAGGHDNYLPTATGLNDAENRVFSMMRELAAFPKQAAARRRGFSHESEFGYRFVQ